MDGFRYVALLEMTGTWALWVKRLLVEEKIGSLEVVCMIKRMMPIQCDLSVKLLHTGGGAWYSTCAVCVASSSQTPASMSQPRASSGDEW